MLLLVACKSFLFFSMANSSIVLKFKVVACMTNIDENYRNVCFNNKVLKQNNTFDYLYSSNVKRSVEISILSLFPLMLPTILLVGISLVRHFSIL